MREVKDWNVQLPRAQERLLMTYSQAAAENPAFVRHQGHRMITTGSNRCEGQPEPVKQAACAKDGKTRRGLAKTLPRHEALNFLYSWTLLLL